MILSNLPLTVMLRSGVRSLKVVCFANTCCVSLTLPDRVSISAAWSTSWFWYCWYGNTQSMVFSMWEDKNEHRQLS